MKRFFDFTAAFIGIVFLIPLFIILFIVILIDDGRPVFFVQKRIGRMCEPFLLYKFRTMRILESAKQGVFEPGNNSRVTVIGRKLRSLKLDELPQLFNVLLGDMSFVGPRPEVKKWVDEYPERWKRILTLRPGITDVASVHFRKEEDILREVQNPETYYQKIILPVKLDYYEKYLEIHTFLGDLRIILNTILVIFKQKKIV